MDEIFIKFRVPIIIFLAGMILIGVGVLSSRKISSPSKIEILNEIEDSGEVTVEISGAVEKAGVYKLATGSRVEDVLVVAGGFSADADRGWVERVLNRAAKITDGQKIYIPKQSEALSANKSGGDQSGSSDFVDQGSGLVSINTATINQLVSLPGIGQAYGQSIIDHRPYSNTSELVSKGAIKQSVYEKVKNQVTIY